MTNANQFTHYLLEALQKEALGYFEQELKLEVSQLQQESGDCEELRIKDSSFTAMMGIEGVQGALIAFNFSTTLTDYVFRKSVEGLGITPEEEPVMRNESMAEMINIIGGHAIRALEEFDETLSLTPPVVISEGKEIYRQRNACLCKMILDSVEGRLMVFIISPFHPADGVVDL